MCVIIFCSRLCEWNENKNNVELELNSKTYILPYANGCRVGIIAFGTHEQISDDFQTKESTVHLNLDISLINNAILLVNALKNSLKLFESKCKKKIYEFEQFYLKRWKFIRYFRYEFVFLLWRFLFLSRFFTTLCTLSYSNRIEPSLFSLKNIFGSVYHYFECNYN